MINYGTYYKSKSNKNKGDIYRTMNSVLDVEQGKAAKKVLFMATSNGHLFTMPEHEFLERFTEVEKEND